MMGQLNGIGRMLDENRYCGEILTQVAAVESALQAFGYLVLQEHMETCVVEEIRKGNVKSCRDSSKTLFHVTAAPYSPPPLPTAHQSHRSKTHT